MPEQDIYYANDVLYVIATLQYEYNGGGLEVTLPAVVEIFDEAHFFRDVAILDSVTPSDAAVPLLFASDSMSVSSTCLKSCDTKVLNGQVSISDDLFTLVQLIEHQYLYSVVKIMDTTKYRITGTGQQQAGTWTRDSVGTPTWTRDAT